MSNRRKPQHRDAHGAPIRTRREIWIAVGTGLAVLAVSVALIIWFQNDPAPGPVIPAPSATSLPASDASSTTSLPASGASSTTTTVANGSTTTTVAPATSSSSQP